MPLAVGAATALRIASEGAVEHVAHYQQLRDQLITGILDAFPNNCRLTGHPTARLPHNASFAFRNLNANDLLMHLDMAGIAASSGSACKTGSPKPAAVLQAMGFSDAWAIGGLRLTVGKQNSPEEMDDTLSVLRQVVPKLYQLRTVIRNS